MANYQDDLNEGLSALTDKGVLSASVAASILAAINSAVVAGGTDGVVYADSAEAIADAASTAAGIVAAPGVVIDQAFSSSSPVRFVLAAEAGPKAQADAIPVPLADGDDADAAAAAPADAEVVPATNGNKIDMSSYGEGADAYVMLSGGLGDSVSTGAGRDTVVLRGGSASISTGAGDDTVLVNPNDGANASIDGGDGFDVVTFTGRDRAEVGAAFTVAQKGDIVGLVGNSGTFQLTNVEIVGFDKDTDGVLDDATVIAQDANDSLVAKLYNIALGRSVLDAADTNPWAPATVNQLAGIQWWMDQSADAATLANMFVSTPEFQNDIAGMDNAQIVDLLFANLAKMGDTTALQGISAADGHAYTKADLVDALNNGDMTVGDVALELATSLQSDDILGLTGQQYVIEGFSE